MTKGASDSNSTEADGNKGIKVAIIGGGIAGFAVARSLQQVGFEDVTVYESDSPSILEDLGTNCTDSASEVNMHGVASSAVKRNKLGYGLTLTYCNGKGPLHSLGVLEKCIELDTPSLFHWNFDRAGRVLGYYGHHFMKNSTSASPADSHMVMTKNEGMDTNSAVVSTSKEAKMSFTRGNLRIPRALLRKLLYSTIENKEYVVKFNKTLSIIEETETGVHLTFKDGQKVTCDVCIGADGIRSLVRAHRDAALDQLLSQQQQHQKGKGKWNQDSNKNEHEREHENDTKGQQVSLLSMLPTEPRNDRCRYWYDNFIQNMCRANVATYRLQYLNITVIIGISSYVPSISTGTGMNNSDLITDGGFYVVDGVNRLFVMPYQQQSNNISSNKEQLQQQQLTMWQLSFSDLTEMQGLQFKYPFLAEHFHQQTLQRTTGGGGVDDDGDTGGGKGAYFQYQCSSYLAEAKRRMLNDTNTNVSHLKKSQTKPCFQSQSHSQQILQETMSGLFSHTANDQVWCSLLYDRKEHLNLWPSRVNLPVSQSQCMLMKSSKNEGNGDSLDLNDNNGVTVATNGGKMTFVPTTVNSTTAVDSTKTSSISIVPGSRLTVVGDAAHCMSMFKGQGANQALQDGPLLAKWLSGVNEEYKLCCCSSSNGDADGEIDIVDDRSGGGSSGNATADFNPSGDTISSDGVKAFRAKLITRLRCYEREMTTRANTHVDASRQAAKYMHSSAILQYDAELYNIQGVTTNKKTSFAHTGKNKNKNRDTIKCSGGSGGGSGDGVLVNLAYWLLQRGQNNSVNESFVATGGVDVISGNKMLSLPLKRRRGGDNISNDEDHDNSNADSGRDHDNSNADSGSSVEDNNVSVRNAANGWGNPLLLRLLQTDPFTTLTEMSVSAIVVDGGDYSGNTNDGSMVNDPNYGCNLRDNDNYRTATDSQDFKTLVAYVQTRVPTEHQFDTLFHLLLVQFYVHLHNDQGESHSNSSNTYYQTRHIHDAATADADDDNAAADIDIDVNIYDCIDNTIDYLHKYYGYDVQ